MLTISEHPDHAALIVTSSGPLNRRDLDALDARVAAEVAAGRTPNLVIRAEGLPTWADIATLSRHLRFIRRHHREIGRVAFVSDARGLDIAPRLARPLIAAETRHFASDDLDAALRWVAGPVSVSLIEGLPAGIFGLTLTAPLSEPDWTRTIAPLVAAHRAENSALLLHITKGFAGLDAPEGSLAGVLTPFPRVAIVSDSRRFRLAATTLRPLIPAELAVFATMDPAVAWLTD